MLAKFKKPEQYIGHGVFVFPEGYYYPVKRKITLVWIGYSDGGWMAYHAFVDGVETSFKASDIFMSKKEARKSKRFHFLQKIRLEKNEIKQLEKGKENLSELILQHERKIGQIKMEMMGLR